MFGEDASMGSTGTAFNYRNSLRITSFSADQIASTAQILISTKPIGKQISRMIFSLISVGTFEAFFGQLTQT